MKQDWEYWVAELGTALKGAKAEEIEGLLNEAAQDKWEPVTMTMRHNSNRLVIVLRRRMDRRTRDRSSTWP